MQSEKHKAAISRGAGILLHITSLPSAFGIGDLGPEAYRFADFLEDAGSRDSQSKVMVLSTLRGSFQMEAK